MAKADTTIRISPYALAILAYGWWGLVPLYWKRLAAFPAEELILYRVLLSSLFLAPFFLTSENRSTLRQLLTTPRTLWGLVLSGLLIGGNWYLYVWAVNHGHVVDASLGYFINPLVNVALGMLLLKETMNRAQKIACGFALTGVLLLTATTGTFPWIALLLAFSFAFYGLLRKILAVPTIPGTFFETIFLSLPCLLALTYFYQNGSGHAPSATGSEWAWMTLCGVVTTVPLLAFAEAAKKMPLSVLGFFQFLSPSIQFLLGVFLYQEPFGLGQWASFAFIWLALLIFLWRR